MREKEQSFYQQLCLEYNSPNYIQLIHVIQSVRLKLIFYHIDRHTISFTRLLILKTTGRPYIVNNLMESIGLWSVYSVF